MDTRWIKRPNTIVSDENTPRRLTPDEISNILKGIRAPFGITKEARDEAHRNVLTFTYLFLSESMISPKAIKKYGNIIVRTYERARVQPGEAAGTRCAESISSGSTQSILKNFHLAGAAANMSSMLEIFTELINVTKNRKAKISTIIFNKRLSYKEVFDMRQKIVCMTVNRLIYDFDILEPNPDKLERYYWLESYAKIHNKIIPNSRFVLRLYFDIYMLFQYKITLHKIIKAIDSQLSVESVTCFCSPLPFVDSFGNKKAIIDIYPNEDIVSERLKAHKLTGFIRMPSQLFLSRIILPSLNKVVIQGISGITDLFPIALPVTKIAQFERKYHRNKDYRNDPQVKPEHWVYFDNLWAIYYAETMLRSTGIKIDDLKNLLTLCGVFVVPPEQQPDIGNFLLVFCGKGKSPTSYIKLKWAKDMIVKEVLTYTPEQVSSYSDFNQHHNAGNTWTLDINPEFSMKDLQRLTEELAKVNIEVSKINTSEEGLLINIEVVNYNTESPLSRVERMVKEDDDEEFKRYQESAKKHVINMPLESPIVKASKFFIAETNGSNLAELLIHEDVNPRYTICNDYHEIVRVLGLDVAWILYRREFGQLMSGQSTNSAHLDLMTFFIFNLGRAHGHTFVGISRQKIGFIDLATFQKAIEVLSKGASQGIVDNLVGTSSSIATGRLIGVGSGVPIIRNFKEEEKKKFLEKLNKGEIKDLYGDNKISSRDIEKVVSESDKYEYEYEKGVSGMVNKEMIGYINLPKTSIANVGNLQKIVPLASATGINMPTLKPATVISQALLDAIRDNETIYKKVESGYKPTYGVPIQGGFIGEVQFKPIKGVELPTIIYEALSPSVKVIENPSAFVPNENPAFLTDVLPDIVYE